MLCVWKSFYHEGQSQGTHGYPHVEQQQSDFSSRSEDVPRDVPPAHTDECKGLRVPPQTTARAILPPSIPTHSIWYQRHHATLNPSPSEVIVGWVPQSPPKWHFRRHKWGVPFLGSSAPSTECAVDEPQPCGWSKQSRAIENPISTFLAIN